MDTFLTLASLFSFFGLVAGWVALPHSAAGSAASLAELAPTVPATSQAA